MAANDKPRDRPTIPQVQSMFAGYTGSLFNEIPVAQQDANLTVARATSGSERQIANALAAMTRTQRNKLNAIRNQ